MCEIVAINSAAVGIVAVDNFRGVAVITADTTNIIAIAANLTNAVAAGYTDAVVIVYSSGNAACIAIIRTCCKYGSIAIAVCNGCGAASPADNTTCAVVGVEISVGNAHIADFGVIGATEQSNIVSSARIVAVGCIVEIQTADGVILSIEGSLIVVRISADWCPRAEECSGWVAVGVKNAVVNHNVGHKACLGRCVAVVVDGVGQPIEVGGLRNLVPTIDECWS